MHGANIIDTRLNIGISTENKTELSNLSPPDDKTNRIAKDQFSLLEKMLLVGTVCLFVASIVISSTLWPLTVLCFIQLLRTNSNSTENRKNEAILENSNQNLEKITDIENAFPQISAKIPVLQTHEAYAEYFQFIPKLREKWATLNLIDKQNKMEYDHLIEREWSAIKGTLEILGECLEDLVEMEAADSRHARQLGRIEAQLSTLNEEIVSLKTKLRNLQSLVTSQLKR